MPALQLRQEFTTPHMRGTAIELRNKQNSGWAQRGAVELLKITFPTADVQRALEAVSTAGSGKPVVFKGNRGRGKSHNLALLYHAFESPDEVEKWAKEWAQKVGSNKLANLKLQRGFMPIAETLSDQEFPTLWDVLFARHPDGQYFRGQFDKSTTSVPAKSLMLDMLAKKPVALILDEFQTWYDGTHDDAGSGTPKRRQWAFNFIQILSEIAIERPDLLVLIISVRDSETDAYRQVHRVGEALVDFKGQSAKDDRKRLVLHRLFVNRDNFSATEIEQITHAYSSERNRLRFSNRTEAEKTLLAREVVDAWPFAPELFDLLEDHILNAGAAQETRDFIRILAEVSRGRLGQTPLITPSDFFIDDPNCGVTTLIDSFNSADQEHLREKAMRNLEAVADAGVTLPHARAVISGIWMRSLDPVNVLGASRQELQLDLTHSAAIDDNAFAADFTAIFESSPNIHEIGTGEKRYCIRIPENPLTKLKAAAKNDKLFEPDTATPPHIIPLRKDQAFIREVLTHTLRSPDGVKEARSRPVVLDPNWQQAPWANVQQNDQPDKWDSLQRPVLVVLPESPADLGATLGPWLKTQVPINRNMAHFLLPKDGLPSIYGDKDLVLLARQVYLAKDWQDKDAQYAPLYKRFKKDLDKELAERFDRYAVLENWDFQTPTHCTFVTGNHGATGSDIPNAVEAKVKQDCFAPEDFEDFIVEASKRSDTMKQVIDLLRSEPLPGKTAIPYLGDNEIFDQVAAVAAKDKIAIDADGKWCAPEPGQSEAEAYAAIRRKASGAGRAFQTIRICQPSATGGGGVSVPTPVVIAPPVTVLPITTPGGPFVPPVATLPLPGINGSGIVVTPPVQPPVVPAAPQAVIRKSLGAKSGINLLAEIEKWGDPDGRKVAIASLTISNLTIKELRDLCTRMPPKLLAEVQIMLNPEEGTK